MEHLFEYTNTRKTKEPRVLKIPRAIRGLWCFLVSGTVCTLLLGFS